eukprot:9369641-Pyramimonas_sp.AAC.1
MRLSLRTSKPPSPPRPLRGTLQFSQRCAFQIKYLWSSWLREGSAGGARLDVAHYGCSGYCPEMGESGSGGARPADASLCRRSSHLSLKRLV